MLYSIITGAMFVREKYLCIAKFKQDENRGYYVEFPDLEGCMTYGHTLCEAMEKAENACAGWLLVAKKNKQDMPESNIDHLANAKLLDGEFQNLFLIDLAAYGRKADRKSVKKNLTLPSWLCERADEKNINYSKVLQDALKDKLGVDDF